MNIKQLIEQLKTYPSEMEVIVDSYEEGFDPVTDTKIIPIIESKTKDWYMGIFNEEKNSKNKAVLISSKYNRADKDVEER